MVDERTQADLEYDKAMIELEQQEGNVIVNNTGGYSFDINPDNFSSGFNSVPDTECTLEGEFIGIRRNPFNRTEDGERDVAVDFETTQEDETGKMHNSSITWNTDRSPWVMRTVLDNLGIEYTVDPFTFDLRPGIKVQMVYKRTTFKRQGVTVSEIQLNTVHPVGTVESSW